jgi:predicted ATPase/class 3 adenylate cyclase
MAELPGGTVTFLFTDLESSTRLWREHPETMKPASARHDAILRDVIEAHSGHLVKTTGDGAHAVFATASDAVAAALAAQLTLEAEAWPLPEPLRVRMGIHSGPAEIRDGDYYGTSVNRAARLMSVAHGGQIVVSLATEELLPDGEVELVDLGEHVLRDLARPERMFQVAHPDLRRDFPPLSSLDAYTGNLPLQVTSFVGREDDVVRVVKLLDEGSMVTLTGTGGVGKTRLAVQVAAEVLPRFTDGAWFCELAAVDDNDAMAQVVSATLGCRPRPELSLAESIVDYLNVRELLLVLDICEDLLDDAGDFADAVLRACPGVRIVATSREALDVVGERVVRVRSLPAPLSTTRNNDLVDSAAVRLFVDRATDAGADSSWDDQQWAAVGEICRRVDGIPLAIELAAARTTAMSPADVAAHLDERFRLLTGKRRGRVERHQTLRATVEWSYQLLGEDERTVFDRLGVFAGTFDAAAATAVAGGDDLDGWLVTDVLASLVAKSMLIPETGTDGSTRYAMLETLRQFARERLDEAGETDRWRRALADHYANAARVIGEGVVGPDHVQWVRRLREDLDNIRAAAGWALERDDPDEQQLALRIVASLELGVSGYPDMGLGPLALQAVDVARSSPPELRVPVVHAAAHAEWNLGNIERARELAHEAVEPGIVASTIDPLAAFTSVVVFEMAAGNAARALELADVTRAAADLVESMFTQAAALASIANFEAMAGQFEQARADAERAVVIARRTENVAAIAVSQHAIAWAFQHEDPERALAAAEEFVGYFREFGVGAGSAASALSMAGGLRARLRDDDRALELLYEAAVLARDQGLRPQLAAALDWALSPLFRRGDADVAATFLGALTGGALEGVGAWPGVAEARARSIERARSVLGDEVDAHLARGAAMGYDEFVAYAIERLEPDKVPDGV